MSFPQLINDDNQILQKRLNVFFTYFKTQNLLGRFALFCSSLEIGGRGIFWRNHSFFCGVERNGYNLKAFYNSYNFDVISQLFSFLLHKNYREIFWRFSFFSLKNYKYLFLICDDERIRKQDLLLL